MSKRIARLVTAVTVAAAAVLIVAAITLCTVFPNKYATAINDASDEFGLDRTLVRSVVWAESKFDPDAVSSKGASGLMQLMPETYDYCAGVLNIDDGSMFDPQNSLRCGCYYLSLMMNKFNGDETAALMAYNAGETNARRFLAGEEVFAETAGYLNSIKIARKVYGFFG